MIPLWLKIVYTILVVVLVPFYWRNYGPSNFLWFSDIAFLLTAVALWSESRFLASTMAVTVLLFETVWNIGYFGRLLTGYRFGGIVDYMFDPTKPLFLRGLSLFHVILPLVLLWIIWRLGYDARAFQGATLLCWIVLPVSYWITTSGANLNWVLGVSKPQAVVHPLAYLAILMMLLPAAVFWPTHLLLRTLSRTSMKRVSTSGYVPRWRSGSEKERPPAWRR